MADDDAGPFPQVQGGGSLMLAWQVRDKKILVVGGGPVAAGRILHCLNADARVTVICPSDGLCPEVAYRIAQGQVAHVDRPFRPSDLDDGHDHDHDHDHDGRRPDRIALVLVAIDDPAASTAIWQLCRARRIPANVADVPDECDFFFGSVHRDGPVQIMVSTNGRGPRLAAALRRRVADALPPHAGRAVEAMGRLRARLRERAPRAEEGPQRMRWISRVSDAYGWEEMAGLTEEDVERLLRFYAADEVPPLEVVRGGAAVGGGQGG